MKNGNLCNTDNWSKEMNVVSTANPTVSWPEQLHSILTDLDMKEQNQLVVFYSADGIPCQTAHEHI